MSGIRRLVLLAGVMLATATVRGEVSVPWQESGVWPESPQARAIRQAEMPAPAMLTGACEFDVPLYTLSVGDVSLPLSLHYRSNGIRVDDDPQPVGYGWTLSPALRVSRQIMGRPDELFRPRGTEIINDYETDFRSVVMDAEATNAAMRDSLKRYDAEHDIYTVYLLDATLTLVRDWESGTFHGVACDEYTITADRALQAIRVTDPRGRVYEFSTPGEYTDERINRTEWLLTSLTLTTGERIDFSWFAFDHIAHGQSFFGPKTVIYGNAGPQFIEQNEPTDGERTKNNRTFGSASLSQITFPGGRVSLSYSSPAGFYMLDSLTVYWGDNVVHRAELTRGRQSSMLLDDVTVGGEGRYSFTYNQGRFTPGGGMDWWGYYNGKYNDYCLSPKVTVTRAGGDLAFPRVFEIRGADRSVDTLAMRANMLESAILPTGGCIRWFYEPHTFDHRPSPGSISQYIDEPQLTSGGGLRVKYISIGTDSLDAAPRVRRYVYGANASGKANVVALPTLGTFIDVVDVPEYRWNGAQPDMFTDKMMTINRTSGYLNGHGGEVPLWYGRVEEIETEGKSVYCFENIIEPNAISDNGLKGFCGHPRNYFSKGPQQVRVERYKSASGGYDLVERTDNSYSLVYGNSRSYVAVTRKTVVLETEFSPDFGERESLWLGYPSWQMKPEYGIRDYAIPIGILRSDYSWFDAGLCSLTLVGERPSGSVVTRYTPTGQIVRSESYTYEPGTSLVATKTLSDGERQVVTSMTYAMSTEGGNNAVVATGAKGMLLSATETFGGCTQGYTNNMEVRGTMPLVTSITLRRGETSWTPASYDYNSGGRLTSKTGEDGITTSWTWDALNRYPLSQTLGGTLTSTARWKPLVGVSSLTAPNGTISTYTYDDEGRLAEEKTNGRIRTRYSYRIAQDGDNRVTTTAYTSPSAFHATAVRADGLGRVAATYTQMPQGYTATATTYDAMGRPWRGYNPTPVSGIDSGASEIVTASASFHGDGHPYTETSYEPSPSATATATAKAGDAWHSAGKAARRRILANNDDTYRCPRYTATEGGVRLDGNYAPGQLEVTEETDEDGVTVRTYKDFLGRTIRRTTGTGNGAVATDYVYDGYGDLRYILPPGLDGTHNRTDDQMKQLAYWYDYDGRGRLVSKKLPGAAVNEYRYDPAGRLVAERDGRLEDDEWNLYAYDGCGRQVAKYCCGMMDDEITEFASVCRTALLTTAADEYDRGGYALSPVPEAWPGDVVWAKYYDDYRFVAVRGLGTGFAFEATAAIPAYASATGLLTGMYTGSGYETYYYDGEGREIQRCATGYNSGRRSTAYNYDGTVSKRTYTYTESYLPNMEEEYAYDNCGRLTSTTIRVDKANAASVPELTAEQNAEGIEATDTASPAASARWATAVVRREYDAIGRLARLRHGDAAATEYTYDVHSWPVSQQTTYGTAANTSSIGYTLEYAPCYNGNISKRTWDEGDYAYSYDALNRLESAVFTPAEELADRPAVERDRIPDFSVYYDYDLRGNTTNVVRYGVVDAVSDIDRVETFGTLDELACSYDGNRLSNITAITDALPFDGVTGLHADGEFELSYNDAGDMVSDSSRGLLYTRWNADGHPMQYDLEGGHRQFLGWDAFGNHLYTSYETSVAPVSTGMRPGRTRRTSVRAYSGDGHVLRGGAGNSAADTLEMLRFAGGYFDANLVPHYYVTDYLGSNIAVIRSDGVLVQSATYYPYGEPHRDPASDAGIGISEPALPMSATASASSNSATASTFSNPYLYGDKEYVRRDGLREYVYGARMCIPSETRFSSMDKHAENYPSFSPYAFCKCNPIVYVDPTGNDVLVYDSRGYLLYSQKNKKYDMIQVKNDDGTIDESLKMKYRTIQSHNTYTGRITPLYTVMRVMGDENGRIIHEFLASHTKVEWGRILVGDGKNSSNFITTTNEEDADGAAMFLFMNQLRYGYHLREKIHNHFESPKPSPWNGDYMTAYGIECILGYHIKHKILFFEKDANSNITPKYYEFSPTNSIPTQEAIDKYGKLSD